MQRTLRTLRALVSAESYTDILAAGAGANDPRPTCLAGTRLTHEAREWQLRLCGRTCSLTLWMEQQCLLSLCMTWRSSPPSSPQPVFNTDRPTPLQLLFACSLYKRPHAHRQTLYPRMCTSICSQTQGRTTTPMRLASPSSHVLSRATGMYALTVDRGNKRLASSSFCYGALNSSAPSLLTLSLSLLSTHITHHRLHCLTIRKFRSPAGPTYTC